MVFETSCKHVHSGDSEGVSQQKVPDRSPDVSEGQEEGPWTEEHLRDGVRGERPRR